MRPDAREAFETMIVAGLICIAVFIGLAVVLVLRGV